MKTSTATVSIAGDLGEKLAAIAKAGFDGIEIFEQDFISFDLNPADVRKMVADHGPVISHHFADIRRVKIKADEVLFENLDPVKAGLGDRGEFLAKVTGD